MGHPVMAEQAFALISAAFSCSADVVHWRTEQDTWSDDVGAWAAQLRASLGHFAPPLGARNDVELVRCHACSCQVEAACVTGMPCRSTIDSSIGRRRSKGHAQRMHLSRIKEIVTWLNVLPSSFHPTTPQGEALAFFRDAVLNRLYNDFDQVIDGREWPPSAYALSMAGIRRADNFAAAVSQAVVDQVPGQIIETGVWRGGLSFLAAQTLDVMGATTRRAYLADSFAGIPKPPNDGRRYSDQDHIAHKLGSGTLKTTSGGHLALTKVTDILNNNSVEWVQRDARRFRLKSSRLRFVPGFFNESLKRLVEEEHDVQFAVVRLDGDTYFSTWDAITVLYPRLSPGGFVLIDDFTNWNGCRDAIKHYRKRHKIKEPLTLIPHRYGEQHMGAYWRKGFAGSTQEDWAKATCLSVNGPSGRVIPSGMYMPDELQRLTKEAIDRESPTRTATMFPRSGPDLLRFADEGDPIHRCVDRGLRPHDFNGTSI